MRSPAVDNYIFGFDEPERISMEILREIIFETIPQIEESIKFNCPFYSYKGLLCYIYWNKTYKKVALGFVKGFRLEDKHSVLNSDTSQIKKLFFDDPESIDIKVIQYFLKQAVQINEKRKRTG